ncbi:MAG: D-alanyl-D-alanine carboxypeptidase [Parachlamydia sp.]|nr:D-alanyl-D-alanine carboxypeptidase [Parachlamydia sp.]
MDLLLYFSRRRGALIAALCLCLPTSAFAAQLSIALHAEAAILINAENGAVLYEKNARKLYYPASITKIATALYALKQKGSHLDDLITAEQEALGSTTADAKLRSNFTLPPYWLENDGTHIGIKRGEQLSLRDLMYGMMLVSGNDAANVIAQYVGGTIPKFMEGLNRYLKDLGCKNTTLHNPHGLHFPQHQTTAQDMALISREAMKDPFFCQVVATVRRPRPKTNKQEVSTLVQGNMLLRSGKYYYPQAIGIKTGYHARAGHTMVAAARKDGRTLIAVLLKEKKRPELFQDAVKMFEAAFQQAKVQRILVRAGVRDQNLSVKGAVKPAVPYLKEDLSISYYPAEEPRVKCLIYWDAVQPPIAKDQRIGEIRVRAEDGRWIASTPLLAKEGVKSSWAFAIKHFFKHSWRDHPIVIAFLSVTGLLGAGFYLRRFR